MIGLFVLFVLFVGMTGVGIVLTAIGGDINERNWRAMKQHKYCDDGYVHATLSTTYGSSIVRCVPITDPHPFQDIVDMNARSWYLGVGFTLLIIGLLGVSFFIVHYNKVQSQKQRKMILMDEKDWDLISDELNRVKLWNKLKGKSGFYINMGILNEDELRRAGERVGLSVEFRNGNAYFTYTTPEGLA